MIVMIMVIVIILIIIVIIIIIIIIIMIIRVIIMIDQGKLTYSILWFSFTVRLWASNVWCLTVQKDLITRYYRLKFSDQLSKDWIALPSL